GQWHREPTAVCVMMCWAVGGAADLCVPNGAVGGAMGPGVDSQRGGQPGGEQRAAMGGRILAAQQRHVQQPVDERRHGSWFSHSQCPRAKLFRRDQGKVRAEQLGSGPVQEGGGMGGWMGAWVGAWVAMCPVTPFHVPTCPCADVPMCPRAHVPTCPFAHVPTPHVSMCLSLMAGGGCGIAAAPHAIQRLQARPALRLQLHPSLLRRHAPLALHLLRCLKTFEFSGPSEVTPSYSASASVLLCFAHHVYFESTGPLSIIAPLHSSVFTRNHPHSQPPSLATTLTRNHPHSQPPSLATTLTRNHPHSQSSFWCFK
ncbi:unnamed protein product, partial [Closterium sp. NIES-53]